MFTWHTAGTYCEEVYGVALDTKEGFFICPDCGEPLLVEDWPRHDWDTCPICGFEFFSE